MDQMGLTRPTQRMQQSVRQINQRVVLSALAFFALSNMVIRLIIFLPVLAVNPAAFPFNAPTASTLPVSVLLGVLIADLLAAAITTRFMIVCAGRQARCHALPVAVLIALFILGSPGLEPAPVIARILLATASMTTIMGLVLYLHKAHA
jgi:hypothetical protein